MKKGERGMQRVLELAFDLTYQSNVAELYTGLAWVVDKLMVLAPVLMSIFADTPWDALSSIARYFQIPLLLNSPSSLLAVVCIIFLLLQLVTATVVYQLIASSQSNGFSSALSINKNKSFGITFLGYALVAIHRMLLQPVTSLFCFFIMLFMGSVDFAACRGVTSDPASDISTWQHIVMFVLLCIAFLQCLLASLCNVFLLNDSSILRVSFWAHCSCQSPALDLLIKLYISAIFSLDPSDSGITYFVSCVLYLGMLGLRFFKTRSQHFYADVFETFYECLGFALQLFVVLGSLLIDTKSSYAIVPVLVVVAVSLSIVRGLMLGEVNIVGVKTEAEALGLLRETAYLCESKEAGAMAVLCSVLCKHIKRCSKEDCECRSLLARAEEGKSEFTQPNFFTYTTRNLLPERIRNSWKLKVLNSLIQELLKKFSKCDDLNLLAAELSFLYLGNYYNSLILLSNLQSRKPSYLMKIQIFNLRQIISLGMETQAEESVDLLESLEYHAHYQRFLQEAEELSELTAKFWTTLLSDSPNTLIMNTIGVSLFNVRKHLMDTVKEISNITTNNVEFYVKYGLCMRIIMHDLSSASSAYNSITRSSETIFRSSRAEEGFSLLRGNRKTLMITISLESSNFMVITDANDEAEDLLLYSRKELIGSKITNIMPPMIAQAHHHFIQQYFHTMESSVIGHRRPRFLKNKDGLYISCMVKKSIVPRLSEGFQGVMFAHVDRRVLAYTQARKDAVAKHTGAVICSNDLKVLGFTKEVGTLLGITDRTLLEITNKTTLDSLFPELSNENAVQALREAAGAVLPLHYENFFAETEVEQFAETKIGETLIWARLVHEKFGNSERATLFLLSIIPQQFARDYIRNEELGVLVNKSKKRYRISQNVEGQRKPEKTSTMRENVEAADETQNLLEGIADHMSVSDSSVSGGNSSVNTGSSRYTGLTRDLIDRTFSEDTPPSIKKLAIVMVLFIVVILVLIIVEVVLCYDEALTLQDRFLMIESYEVRYKHSLILYNNVKSLYRTRDGGDERSFEVAYYRIQASVNSMSKGHINTLKNFAELGLDYGTHPVTITDHGDVFDVVFNHAMIKLVNRCLTILKSYPYAKLVELYLSPSSSECISHQDAANYVEANTFMAMRVYQDKYSALMRHELEDLAAFGEEQLYVVVGCCIGIVFVSIGLISPVFFWVIRDKSYVLAIFADILDGEIRSVIELTEMFDVKCIRYRRRWLMEHNSDEDKFWEKIMREQKRTKQKQLGIAEEEKKEVRKEEEHKPAASSPAKRKEVSEAPLNKELSGVGDNEDNQKPLDEMGNTPNQPDSNTMGKDSETLAKCTSKKAILSQLDVKLRNNAIIRLLIVLFVFMVYGGISLYFNYFFHDFNRSTTYQFYVLHKRSLNIPTVGSLLRKGVSTGDMSFLTRNTKGDGVDYLQEVVDRMLKVEADMKDFEKHGSRAIFPKYFDLVERYNSPEFCAIVDSLEEKQAELCVNAYEGPRDQGLSGGMAYLIEFHDTFAIRAINTDFTNATQITLLQDNEVYVKYLHVVSQYLLPALEDCMIIFRKEAESFFELIEKLAIIKASLFSAIFLVVYLTIFIYFLNVLKMEIWQTQSIINMIPDSILEKNRIVQEQVWKRKGVSAS